MCDFEPIFDKVIDIEGGYTLHEVEGDSGGMTYAGIARNSWTKWEGWAKVDRKEFDDELKSMVKKFFKVNFWDKIKGDRIGNALVAYHIYSFGVNAGLPESVKITQRIIGAKVDGVFGPKTFRALNVYVKSPEYAEIFSLKFSLEKVFRYNFICRADKRRKKDKVYSNLKFLGGWINRVKKGLEYGEQTGKA